MKGPVDVIALTQELVRINTINPPGNELAAMEVLTAILSKYGFKTSLRMFGEGRANLIAMLGDNRSEPGLCLSGHVDTVELGKANWTRDPFGGEIDGGRLFGRGSTDMKAGVAAIVAASCSAASLFQGRGRLFLIFTAGEETGCEGARSLALESELPPSDALIITEPTGNRPVIGHKGMAWLQATLRGRTAHGSMPELGVNAAYKAADLVCRLRDIDFNLDDERLGRPSINVGQVHSGSSFNSVPDLAEVSIDIRTVPGVRQVHLEELIKPGIGDEDELNTVFFLNPVLSDPRSKWIKEVCSIVENKTARRIAPSYASFFTDAGVLKPALGNPQTIILGPGEPSLAHKTDEYCLVSNIHVTEEILLEVIGRWFKA